MKFYQTLIIILLLCITISCGDFSETSSNDNSSSNVNLSFATTDGANSTSNLIQELTLNDYCHLYENDSSTSQKCTSSPNGYNMGILAIYLIDCVDENNNSVTCNDESMDKVAARYAIYEGDQVDLEINDIGTEFSETLEDISKDINIGGIQIVTAYLEQDFPESGDDADKITKELQGKSYRICLSPDTEIDEDTMEIRCGKPDAIKGDYLIDLDGSGFGFIDMDTLAVDVIEVAETRHEDYDLFNDSTFQRSGVCFNSDNGCEEEYTSLDFYDVEGYFAPILSLSAVEELEANTPATINVVFNIGDTFHWVDGADEELPDDICVSAVADEECAEDADPDTVGIYHPYRDTAFLPTMAHVDVTIE